MSIEIPGYAINEIPIYTGLYTIIFSSIRNQDKATVVIKLLKKDHPCPDDILRFKHEFEVAKSFDSIEDVVHVSALEKHDNSYAIVMENISSPPLAEILEKEKKINVNEFLELAIHMAEALGHIHQHNVIHKDINPSNIMCNFQKKEVKIIDFGLSANLPKERAEIVSPNVLEGTLAYLSPEQTGRMNRGIDYRTDYYSLGVTFYQMLTGKLPFISEDPMELVHFHIAVIPKTPHEIDPSIPEVISSIIMKLLAKKAEDRYQNANGLIADLKECHQQLINTGKISPFPLGSKDVFSRFQIPEKLYGRENEINTLLTTYEKVMQGGVELMLVAGYSGIGKSALVHEIHKPIVKKHGYFISGKFDQFKHNIPYAAVNQAFDEFIKQILTESDDRITFFREKIIAAVGENGKIITDVIPNLISIIGEQPPVPELGPTESQNRFSYVFQNFIKSLSASDHPLVIFLDDLQWADLSSLKMLETLITSADCRYLFIIGAYRSNEVSSAHPLMVSIAELKKRNIEINTIELGSLSISHVSELLSDTLHQDKNSIQPLAQVCFDKTSGNPFFLIQLLLSLYKEQLIEFNSQKNEWIWHLEEIQLKGITDNVVQLMINKIKELPSETQQAMQMAACIGNQFDLDLLSSICKKEPETILINIQEALREGYILCHGDSYRAVSYQFAHDRIQQAAYSLINEDERKKIHIDLARLILKKTSEDKLSEVIFDVANHYNTAIDTEIPNTIDATERKNIAALNLQATQAAKSAAAFEPAMKYIEYGLKCVSDDAWQVDYRFMIDLYQEATEAAYLSTKYDKMNDYAEICLKNAKDISDEFKIINTQIIGYIAQLKPKMAIALAVKTLARINIKLPKNPKLYHVLLAIMRIKFLLIGKKIPDLINMPEMTDKTKKAAMELLTLASAPAYQADPNLFPLLVMANVTLSLKYGNTKLSAYSYAVYGLMSCGILYDIDGGYQFGELALNLMEKFHIEDMKTKIIFMNICFIKPWKDPIYGIIPKLAENFQRGYDNGDFEYGSYSGTTTIFCSIHAGVNLKDNLDKLTNIYEPGIKNMKQINNYHYIRIYHQVLLNLIEKQDDVSLISGSAYNETETLPSLIEANEKLAIFWIYSHKVMLLYLFERVNETLEYINRCDKYADAAISNFTLPAYYLYKSLSLLKLYESSSRKQKYFISRSVNKCKKIMAIWAKFAPANHATKLYIVNAELAWRINKDYSKAAKLFDKAIESAKKTQFLNEEALANELAAKLYLAQGKDKIARIYFEDARHCYLLWGADAKVVLLDETYPQLLEKSTAESFSSTGKTRVSTSASDRAGSQALDMGTIQKSSQAISSTIVLEELLKKLMQIVIENAGAQKSYLLLNKDGKFVIEAEGNVDQKEANVLKSITITPDILPISMINYVANSKEFIVLDNATRSERYESDPYVINKQPKSILCMPLLNQGTLSGILYMENNLTEGAFTKDRINVLNLLSSQIAISIDNARLYSNTQELNKQLTALVGSYERFVPKDFLSLLEKKSIVDVGLGDQVQKNMSILFTDIRSFTTLSEKMNPQENFNFINSFLSVMGPVIRKHRGFVDKYIGDAIMALYPDDADDAVQCSLEMQHALVDFNNHRIQEGKDPIAIGIGINTGSLMLGTVGEMGRMNATVISDTVNTASRVESLTKNYKIPILITENTLKNLKNPSRYHIEMVDDQVLVKGKTKPIAVYKVEELK